MDKHGVKPYQALRNLPLFLKFNCPNYLSFITWKWIEVKEEDTSYMFVLLWAVGFLKAQYNICFLYLCNCSFGGR